MLEILLGVLAACSSSWGNAQLCIQHYTNPAQLQAHWEDYMRFKGDIRDYAGIEY